MVEKRGAELAAAIGSILTSLLIAVWTLRFNLGAAFGPIDDSEQISWLHSDGTLPLSDALPTLLNETEVGRFGEYARFRPAIYVTKVLETVAFGSDVRLHYVSVIAMFVAACALLGLTATWWISAAARIASRRTAIVVAASASVFATMFFAGIGAWSDIATRLGPSERLAVLGLAIMLLGLTALGFDRHPGWWAAALAGVTLSVLSKENFIVLALAPLMMALYRRLALRRSRYEIVAGVVGLLPAVLLAWALAPTMFGGRDIYGAETGTSRLASTAASLFTTYRWYWLPAVVMLVLSWAVWAWVRGRHMLPATVLVGGYVLLGILWRVHDGWVYAVHGYAYPRYEVVPQLFKALALMGAVALALAAVRRAGGRVPLVLSALALALVCIVTLAAARAVPAALASLRDQSLVNREATRAYSDALDAVVEASRVGGNLPVAIVAREPMDGVEMARAIALDLRRRGPELDVVVVPDLTADQASSPLAGLLGELSSAGNPAVGLQSISAVPDGSRLVCAIINADTTASRLCSPDLAIRVPARYM